MRFSGFDQIPGGLINLPEINSEGFTEARVHKKTF
jgi:hypothetical protein